MDWLIGQAQTASPFVAMFCLVVGGSAVWILWRQHLADQKRYDTLIETTNKALNAIDRAMVRLATMIEKGTRKR